MNLRECLQLAKDAGFDVETNRVTFISPNQKKELPLLTKREVADQILDEAVALKGQQVVQTLS